MSTLPELLSVPIQVSVVTDKQMNGIDIRIDKEIIAIAILLYKGNS